MILINSFTLQYMGLNLFFILAGRRGPLLLFFLIIPHEHERAWSVLDDPTIATAYVVATAFT